MASRQAYYRAKSRHSQREFGYVKPTVVKEDAWINQTLEACRALAAEGNIWGADEFASALQIPVREAELRLRHLCKINFLHMSAERVDGVFKRYTWRMVDPELPRASEI